MAPDYKLGHSILCTILGLFLGAFIFKLIYLLSISTSADDFFSHNLIAFDSVYWISLGVLIAAAAIYWLISCVIGRLARELFEFCCPCCDPKPQGERLLV